MGAGGKGKAAEPYCIFFCIWDAVRQGPPSAHNHVLGPCRLVQEQGREMPLKKTTKAVADNMGAGEKGLPRSTLLAQEWQSFSDPNAGARGADFRVVQDVGAIPF